MKKPLTKEEQYKRQLGARTNQLNAERQKVADLVSVLSDILYCKELKWDNTKDLRMRAEETLAYAVR